MDDDLTLSIIVALTAKDDSNLLTRVISVELVGHLNGRALDGATITTIKVSTMLDGVKSFVHFVILSGLVAYLKTYLKLILPARIFRLLQAGRWPG